MRTIVLEENSKKKLDDQSDKIICQKNLNLEKIRNQIEIDFLRILEFDMNIWTYKIHPLMVPSNDVPENKFLFNNFLVNFRDDIEPAKDIDPLLYVVIKRGEIQQNWTTLKPQFSEILNQSSKKGWKFKILTEKEVYSEFFLNAKFLLMYKYKEENVDWDLILKVERLLADMIVTTPQELITAASFDKEERLIILYTLWYMIANYQIGCDLNKKLTMTSEIWNLD